jgi:hypothetical protein
MSPPDTAGALSGAPRRRYLSVTGVPSVRRAGRCLLLQEQAPQRCRPLFGFTREGRRGDLERAADQDNPQDGLWGDPHRRRLEQPKRSA